MAFRVPAQPPRRQATYAPPEQPPELDTSFSQHIPDDESTQWVLFSPSRDASVTDHTRSASTENTRKTTGPRLSDFGSFGTPTRSGTGVESTEDDDHSLENLDEDDWDSLDDGLHAFPDPSNAQATSSRWDQGDAAVLPAHDGLGSFMNSSRPVQEQSIQFDQSNLHHNPQPHLRSMSSIRRQLDTVAENEEIDVERERWERIEKWRIDQSRAILREVERETRFHRRNSRVSLGPDNNSTSRSAVPSVPEAKDERSSSPSFGEADYESFWQRITRTFIRNVMGIDDSLLSVILGDSQQGEEEKRRQQEKQEQQEQQQQLARQSIDERSDRSSYDFNAMMEKELDSMPNDDQQQHWQAKLLQRIARELGVLIHQFVGHPPGAFSTYSNLAEDISKEYAGMTIAGNPGQRDARRNRSSSDAPSARSINNNVTASISSPLFSPTLHDPSSGLQQASNFGIEDEDDPQRIAADEQVAESTRLQQEREYWERDLDVNMVFRYLRDRFGIGGGNTPDDDDSPNLLYNRNHLSDRAPSSSTGPSSYRLQQQDPSRRAAIIRQHHPLVAHAHSRSLEQTRHRQQYYHSPQNVANATNHHSHQRFRSSSSCASQSAKLSVISSKKTLTGSSRNYWDFGGCTENGNAIGAVAAGIGAWGDL